ncbi:hypothetical protein V6Z11_D07G135100 [Gossypium hirsutum]
MYFGHYYSILCFQPTFLYPIGTCTGRKGVSFKSKSISGVKPVLPNSSFLVLWNCP